jgi:putative endonuclease
MVIHVYVLRCSDGSYYTGIARKELEARVSEHQQGHYRGYTFKRRPVLLVWSAEFLRLTDAIARERQIKGWSRVKKEALIRGDYAELSELSHASHAPHPSTSSG